MLLNEYRHIFERNMLTLLQEEDTGVFSNEGRFNEPRVVAENVQEVVKENFVYCFEEGMILEDLSDTLTRRSMADILVVDNDDVEYSIDIKTHNIGTDFSMPNITSVDILSRYYSKLNDDKCFMVLLVEYDLNLYGVEFLNVKLFLLENMNWECLRIGALGAGQIQIKNSNDIRVDYQMTRDEWMDNFFDEVDEFYTIEIEKNETRRNRMRERAEDWYRN